MTIPPMAEEPLIHPLELAFCGYSGTGKTTMLSKLTRTLANKYRILYYKHDAHGFEMDREGKDTQVLSDSGAAGVVINDPHRLAMIGGEASPDRNYLRPFFSGYDFALVEGGKSCSADKVVFLDPHQRILDQVSAGEIDRVIAWVGSEPPAGFLHLPYFHRDRVEELAEFIEGYFHKKAAPLRGLITIGGKSARMGRDKFSLLYQGEKSIPRLYRMLSQFCDQVYLSCREDQKEISEVVGYPQIHDRIMGVGPVGGILSAQMAFPDTAWLVVAVDMPHIDEETISYLIRNRDPFRFATCFKNQEKLWPEPLCAIYEPKSKFLLLQGLASGHYCPRKLLTATRTRLLHPPHQRSLFNVNTPSDYQEALQKLS